MRTGEIEQLAPFVGPVLQTRRADRGLLDRYEAHWRTEHPGAEPGPRLRRAWDARAWAEDRPDKVIPRSGDELRQRWLAELAGLGYRDRDKPIQLALQLPGALDRDAAVAEVVTRLGAARSAWNAADVRGQVEQLLARAGIVADAGGADRAGRRPHRPRARAVRAAARGRDTRTHPRAHLPARARRGGRPRRPARRARRRPPSLGRVPVAPATVDGLDAGQRAAVAALAGDAATGRGGGRGRCGQDDHPRRGP